MSVTYDLSQPLELTFMEAAFAGNDVGYEFPEYIECSWDNRHEGLSNLDVSKAMSTLMQIRLDWWGLYLESNPNLTPETLLLCPWGGYVALVVSQQLPRRKAFHISAFTGKKKPSKAFAQKPFITFGGVEARDAAYHINKLLDHQKEAMPVVNPHAVGDVLYGTWGIEQTSVFFYQVISVKGQFISVRKIDCITELDVVERLDREMNLVKHVDSMTGFKAPLINSFIGEELKRKVTSSGAISVDSYHNAYKLGFFEQFGVKIYEGVRFSSYA